MIVHRPNATSPNVPISKGIKRVQSMSILGVTMQHNLRVNEHIQNVVTATSQNLYALKTLKAHGMDSHNLSIVCRATLVSRLVYASQAWRGFATAAELARLEGVLKRAKKWGVCLPSAPTIENEMNKADHVLFCKVLNNPTHVLHYLLPPIKSTTYNLRPATHNRILPVNSTTAARNFIHRMLYS